MMKPWQQFNFGYLYSLQNGHNFKLLAIVHISDSMLVMPQKFLGAEFCIKQNGVDYILFF